MAREWSLQETKVLVEEHIALKEEEKLESRTASEHWSKVAKKLREKGFHRSHKSCNKRWYRLEQYELQIFSFNIEEGKNKNYWDLTRAERSEYRDKWPQLPSGDGIDKEMFDLLKNFSHQYEKEKVEPTTESPLSVDIKEVVHAKPITEINRQSAPPPSPPVVASPYLTPRILPHTIVTSGDEQSKPREESPEAQKPSKSDWPAVSEQPPLSSPGALDGFKLQARELRRRRAAEFRKNNRTVPYNSSHTTFTKVTQPVSVQLSMTESTTFGSITVIPPPESTTSRATSADGETPIMKNLPKDHTNVTQTKPQIQFKRLFNSSPNQASENLKSNNPHPQPIGGHLNFQSQSASYAGVQQGHALGQGKYLLQSINSHVPLLQPKDNHFSHPNNKNVGSANVDRKTLLQELLHLGSLEEQLQMILDVHCDPLQNGEQLQKKNTDDVCRHGSLNGSLNGSPGQRSMLGVAIGGLGVQLGAMVKLLQAKHAGEQEFREKMLALGECMVVSLRSMAQANVHTSG